MNNKKIKLFASVAIPIIGIALLGTGVASARGMGGMGGGMWNALTPEQISSQHQAMFQEQASLLGISVDDIKNGWAQGKTLKQMATEHGITASQLAERLNANRISEMKAQLQYLVSSGVITQTQADSRLQFMQNNEKNGKGMMGNGFGRWHRQGRK